jgi:hypothetical protein
MSINYIVIEITVYLKPAVPRRGLWYCFTLPVKAGMMATWHKVLNI